MATDERAEIGERIARESSRAFAAYWLALYQADGRLSERTGVFKALSTLHPARIRAHKVLEAIPRSRAQSDNAKVRPW
jgi:hypothetical protein